MSSQYSEGAFCSDPKGTFFPIGGQYFDEDPANTFRAQPGFNRSLHHDLNPSQYQYKDTTLPLLDAAQMAYDGAVSRNYTQPFPYVSSMDTSLIQGNTMQGISTNELMEWLQTPMYPSLFSSTNSAMYGSTLDQASSSAFSANSSYSHPLLGDIQSPPLSASSPSLMQSSCNTPAASDITPSDAAMSPRLFQEPIDSSSAITITSDITLRGGKSGNTLDVQYPKFTNSFASTSTSAIDTTPYSSPPSTDFKSTNTVDMPRKQLEKRRGQLDLYTPVYIRGEGMSREGWCRFCSPGCWLNLKTSQYLYHLQNAHGICQITGQVCTPPLQLRIYHDGSQVTDGLCGTCHQWITIGTARRRRNFSSWFEHARKCHRKDRPRRAQMTTSSSSSSLLPGSTENSTFVSRVCLQAPSVTTHQRAQSCSVHHASPLGNVFSHKRGAESVSLPVDVKKPRQ